MADIAWNLSILLSAGDIAVQKALQELSDRLPHLLALHTDSLPDLSVLHQNRALSLAAAASDMMAKHEKTLHRASNSGSPTAAAGALAPSSADATEDNDGYITVLQNLITLQLFHLRRARMLNMEYKSRTDYTGWL